jgi:hypothetical protein
MRTAFRWAPTLLQRVTEWRTWGAGTAVTCAHVLVSIKGSPYAWFNGGQLHIADWGRAPDPLMRAAFFALQLVDGFAGTRDHVAGRLPKLIAATRLTDVRAH